MEALGFMTIAMIVIGFRILLSVSFGFRFGLPNVPMLSAISKPLPSLNPERFTALRGFGPP